MERRVAALASLSCPWASNAWPKAPESFVSLPGPATGGGVEVRRQVTQRRVGMANHGQQVEVKVEVLDGYQIDDADRHAFLEQRRTFGDKDISMFRTILVRGTDDFDGRDQVPPAPRIEDSDLVLVVIR